VNLKKLHDVDMFQVIHVAPELKMCHWKGPGKSSSKALFLLNHGQKCASSVSMEALGWVLCIIFFHSLPCFIGACDYFHHQTGSACEIRTDVPRKKN